MAHRFTSLGPHGVSRDNDEGLDLDALLHPAHAFEHPMNVVHDPDLTLSEKRAILASWASDACAVEAAPALRHAPSGRTVEFDDVMDALRALDQQTGSERKRNPHYRKVLAQRRPGVFGRRSQGPNDQGPAPN
jgi:hypothetical protein